MKTFITRSLTAVVFLAVMVGGIWCNIYTFTALFALINLGCMYEYLRMCEIIIPGHTFSPGKKGLTIVYSFLMILIPFYYALFFKEYFYFTGISFGLLALIMLSAILTFTVEILSPRFNVLTVFCSIAGIIYITLPLSLISYCGTLNIFDGSLEQHKIMVLAILMLIWTNDTMAYITGMLVGKHPFMAHISPKKTWEGIMGGVVCTTLITWLLNIFLIRYNIKLIPWWIVGPAISILATLGDLAKSMIKRNAGVKDSGNILPGHGGFLDRYDAMLFALPPVFVYVLLTNHVWL